MILSMSAVYASRLIKSLDIKEPLAIHKFCANNPDLSYVFVARVASLLKRKGIIKSQRGAGGGYVRSKKLVTLHDLLSATTNYKTMPGELYEAVNAKLKEIVITD